MNLRSNDVHIWRIPLDLPDLDWPAISRHLSSDERIKMDSFIHAQSRRCYGVSRFALRDILGKYLDKEKSEIQFETQSNGKPVLSPPWTSVFSFNLSHSGELALCAISADAQIGVDVERVRPIEDVEKLATRFLSPEESSQILGCDLKNRLDRFFEIWTAKESYLKALGVGISGQLDEPLPSAQEIAIHHWHIEPLEVPSGYLASVAVCKRQIQISYFDWMMNE